MVGIAEEGTTLYDESISARLLVGRVYFCPAPDRAAGLQEPVFYALGS
jgi:hypothetical protein